MAQSPAGVSAATPVAPRTVTSIGSSALFTQEGLSPSSSIVLPVRRDHDLGTSILPHRPDSQCCRPGYSFRYSRVVMAPSWISFSVQYMARPRS